MKVDSIAPYFILMVLLWAAAWLVVRFSTSFRNEIESDAKNPSFSPQLEGLRGLLAFSVFFHHVVVFYYWKETGIWEAPPSRFYSQMGVLPVTMFFFLTGYLFWAKTLAKPRIHPVSYLWARFRRLGPVYVFALAIIYILVAYRSHFILHTSLSHLLKSSASWLVFGIHGLPDINGVSGTEIMIAATPWTLTYEWLFYCTLPFLVWFARVWYRSFLIVFAALILASLSINTTKNVSDKQDMLMAVNFCRAMTYMFGSGIVVASLRYRFRAVSVARTKWASIVSVAIILIVAFFLPPLPFYGPECIVLSIPFGLIVFGDDLSGLLRSSPMLLMGKVSYSCYLLHGLVLWLTLSGLGRWHSIAFSSPIQYWCLCSVIGLFVLAISCVSYRFLEYPYLRTAPKVDLKHRAEITATTGLIWLHRAGRK